MSLPYVTADAVARLGVVAAADALEAALLGGLIRRRRRRAPRFGSGRASCS